MLLWPLTVAKAGSGVKQLLKNAISASKKLMHLEGLRKCKAATLSLRPQGGVAFSRDAHWTDHKGEQPTSNRDVGRSEMPLVGRKE